MSAPTKSTTKSKGDSGAGVRPIQTDGGVTSPKEGKKKTSTKASSTTTITTTASKVDSISAPSASDLDAITKNLKTTQLATESAYPLLHAPFNPDDDVDEEIDEEQLKQQMADLMKEEEPTPRALTLELIRQRTLPKDLLESGNQELISKKLFQLERIYLDGLSLNSIDDSFDLFSNSLTHLYLQRNLLLTTHGFSCLKNLQFLMLAQNRIRVVEGLEKLEKLVFLDLSQNLIEMLDTGSEEDDSTCQLPASLVVLNFAGNPFTQDEDYVEHIVTVSPYLKTLDGQPITNAMRRNFGLEASDDDEDDESALPTSAPLPSGSASARRSAAILAGEDEIDEDDADEEDVEAAAEAVRQQTEEIKKRSQQRTMLYDTQHGVTQSTTQKDREESLATLQQEEAAKNKK